MIEKGFREEAFFVYNDLHNPNKNLQNTLINENIFTLINYVCINDFKQI